MTSTSTFIKNEKLLETISEQHHALIIFTSLPFVESLQKYQIYNEVNYLVDGQLNMLNSTEHSASNLHLFYVSQFGKDFFVLLISDQKDLKEKLSPQLKSTIELIIQKSRNQNKLLVLGNASNYQRMLESNFPTIEWKFDSL